MDRTSPTDEEILRLVAAGDLSRFDELMDRYKARVVNYAYHRLGDVHQAEDVAQEAFMRLFRGNYNGKARVSTWLFTIVRNCVTDCLRARGRRPLVLAGEVAAAEGPPEENPADDPTPEDVAIRSECAQRVQQALAELPEPQREVVTLKAYGGLTLAETAVVLGCPLPTAKSRLRYAMEKLHRLLKDIGESQP